MNEKELDQINGSAQGFSGILKLLGLLYFVCSILDWTGAWDVPGIEHSGPIIGVIMDIMYVLIPIGFFTNVIDIMRVHVFYDDDDTPSE